MSRIFFILYSQLSIFHDKERTDLVLLASLSPYHSTPLSYFLDVLLFSDYDQDIAILDHIISPQNHPDLIRKHLFYCNHIDMGFTSQMEISDRLSVEPGRRGHFNEGVAFPHVRVEGLMKPVVVLGLTRQGVSDASPEKPIGIVFLNLSPAQTPDTQAQVSGVTSRAVRNRPLIQSLRSRQTPEEVMAAIRDWETGQKPNPGVPTPLQEAFATPCQSRMSQSDPSLLGDIGHMKACLFEIVDNGAGFPGFQPQHDHPVLFLRSRQGHHAQEDRLLFLYNRNNLN